MSTCRQCSGSSRKSWAAAAGAARAGDRRRPRPLPHARARSAHGARRAHTRRRAPSRSGSVVSAPTSPTSTCIRSRRLRRCASACSRPLDRRPAARLAGPHRRRPGDSARGADAAGVLHGRRQGARACGVPARRRAAAGSGAAASVDPRLLRVRGARAASPRAARGRPPAAGVVRASRLLLLEPGGGVRARRHDPVPGGRRGARLRARACRGDRRGRARSAVSRS